MGCILWGGELRLTLEESGEIVRMKARKLINNKIAGELHKMAYRRAAGLLLMMELAKSKSKNMELPTWIGLTHSGEMCGILNIYDEKLAAKTQDLLRDMRAPRKCISSCQCKPGLGKG